MVDMIPYTQNVLRFFIFIDYYDRKVCHTLSPFWRIQHQHYVHKEVQAINSQKNVWYLALFQQFEF